MIRNYLPKDLQELVRWYERYVSPVSLVLGFLADNYILLRRVDLWTSNALLFFYLAVCAGGILLINAIEEGRVKNQRIVGFAPLIPVAVQFSFGGLFSGYLSLYSRSAGLVQSWVFVVALAILLLSNERFVRLYRRFSFQIPLYFTVLFSFFTFFLPVVVHQIGPIMFLASGCFSIGAIALLLWVLSFVAPQREAQDRTRVARSIALIFIIFNILYFSNLIPPLPLSLKEAGVYHEITRTNGVYRLAGEPMPWYEDLIYHETFHRAPGESVFVFTAIFAPSGLTTPIIHEWQRYDEGERKWVTTNTVTFSINGGRDGGYRGYSEKSGVSEGTWRVNVLTQYGAGIGRVSFNVVNATATPPLVVKEE
jgi:hypothetical protein